MFSPEGDHLPARASPSAEQAEPVKSGHMLYAWSLPFVLFLYPLEIARSKHRAVRGSRCDNDAMNEGWLQSQLIEACEDSLPQRVMVLPLQRGNPGSDMK